MQENAHNDEVSSQNRKGRLKLILIVHLMVAIAFFVSAFVLGKFT